MVEEAFSEKGKGKDKEGEGGVREGGLRARFVLQRSKQEPLEGQTDILDLGQRRGRAPHSSLKLEAGV